MNPHNTAYAGPDKEFNSSGTITVTNEDDALYYINALPNQLVYNLSNPKVIKEILSKEDNLYTVYFNVAGNNEDDLSIVRDKENNMLYIKTIDDDSLFYINFSYVLPNYNIKKINKEVYWGVLEITLQLEQFEEVD